MHGHETDRREVMSPRQASAVLEDIALEPQPYGMRAEAIGYAQREGETLETGVLLGGDRLRRHFGPPAHADGWVSVQVGLTDGIERWPASGHYDAQRLRRGLEEGVPPMSLEEHEREWQKGTNPKGHDEPASVVEVDTTELVQALRVAQAGATPNVRATYVHDGVGLAHQPTRAVMEIVMVGGGVITAAEITVMEWNGQPWHHPRARRDSQGHLLPEPPPDPPLATEDPRAVIIPGSVANALIRMESTLSTVGERPCTITLRDGWQIEIALPGGIIARTKVLEPPLASWRYYAAERELGRVRARFAPDALAETFAKAEEASSARKRRDDEAKTLMKIDIGESGLKVQHLLREVDDELTSPMEPGAHCPIAHGTPPARSLRVMVPRQWGDVIVNASKGRKGDNGSANEEWTVTYGDPNDPIRAQHRGVTLLTKGVACD